MNFVKGTDEVLAKVLYNWGHWERQLHNAKGLSWYYGAPESAAQSNYGMVRLYLRGIFGRRGYTEDLSLIAGTTIQ
jgi:hypothetical protein